MLTSSYFELVPNVSLLLFHQIFSRAASLFGENFSPNSDLRSWSAVVARSLTTGDEQQVSEEEISKLQRVFSESPCFSSRATEALPYRDGLGLDGRLWFVARGSGSVGDLQIIPFVDNQSPIRHSDFPMKTIFSTTVWMRLLVLPSAYWEWDMILAIASSSNRVPLARLECRWWWMIAQLGLVDLLWHVSVLVAGALVGWTAERLVS